MSDIPTLAQLRALQASEVLHEGATLQEHIEKMEDDERKLKEHIERNKHHPVYWYKINYVAYHSGAEYSEVVAMHRALYDVIPDDHVLFSVVELDGPNSECMVCKWDLKPAGPATRFDGTDVTQGLDMWEEEDDVRSNVDKYIRIAQKTVDEPKSKRAKKKK